MFPVISLPMLRGLVLTQRVQLSVIFAPLFCIFFVYLYVGPNHKLNMEVDLQSLFGLHVT
jgi:hypothetical protein